MIIAPKLGNEIDDIKNDIRLISKQNKEIPPPRDVIKTKSGQLIIKMKSKVDMEKMRSNLLDNEQIKNKSRISISRRGKEKLLLLGVSKEVEEPEIEPRRLNIWRGSYPRQVKPTATPPHVPKTLSL